MQQLRLAALVVVLYLAMGFLSRTLAHAATQTTPVWLAAGVIFSALLISGRWSWPAILIAGAIAATIWVVIAHGLGLGGSMTAGAIESASMAVGAWIATLGRHDPRRPAGTGLLIAGALIGSALGGLLGAQLWRWQGRGIDFLAEWLAWTISTGLGVLLVTPVVIAFRGFRVKRSGGMPMPQFLGGALAFLAFVVTVLVVFDDRIGELGTFAPTLAYVPMPFLLLAGLLWGPRGGSLAVLAGALLMIWRTANGGGPFAITQDFPGEPVIEAQAFVAVWALVILLGRALVEERFAALERARDWRLRYERIMLAIGVASVEYDVITGRAIWGEGAALVLGPAVSTVSSVSEWLDRVDASERGLVQAMWTAVASGEMSASEQEYAVHLGGGELSRVNEQLAGVRGADGEVEQVVAMLRLAAPEAAR
jgi:integral membrane sensor domain MASE1